MSVDTLLAQLDRVHGKAPRWRSVCPAHESKHGTRSLSIYEPDPGRILLKCHTGCDVGAIVAKLGMELSDLFPPRVDDDKRKPRIKKPWPVSHVVNALRGELYVGAVILADVAAGKPHDAIDRGRAGLAIKRIGHFLDELEHAH